MSRTSNTEHHTPSGSSTGHARDKAVEVGESLRDLGGQVRDAAQEQYESLRDTASDYYQRGRDRARQWEDGIERYIQDKPIKSILIAAGVGVLIGMFWRRH